MTCSLFLIFTAEIQHCLVSAGDVGCGVFECFENNSCEIRGLQEICMTFLHNAGKFDSQVMSLRGFISLRLEVFSGPKILPEPNVHKYILSKF